MREEKTARRTGTRPAGGRHARRPRRAAAFWVAALLPVAALLAPPAATAATAARSQPQAADIQAQAVANSAVFNHPDGTTAQQNAIRDHVANLVNGTPAGARIDVSMFSFTDDTVADALVAASARGVNVHVIVDESTVDLSADADGDGAPDQGGEYHTLAAGLGENLSARSWILACPDDRGCVGHRTVGASTAINHNKFFLFSETGGTADVVVQTSANMTSTQRTDLFNNAVTIVDPGLYDIYRDYFDDLLAHGTSPTGLTHYYRTPTSATDGSYKAYFFPRRETSGTAYNGDPDTDTIVSILENVDCPGGTEVRMAANLFTRTQVAEELVRLVGAGCRVLLAHDDSGDGTAMSARVEEILYGRLTQRVQCNEGPRGIGLHSKYITVTGGYYGLTNQRLVFTGSHNYTYPALRAHDETLLKIDDPALHTAFRSNHQTLMEYCAGS
ncbi:phospholipase D-like domain-containing protein [Allostreptomyces psammosilenae]|uniref:phospholipase D n=1 Tax=Allostreptomyces psammosilenae TaxID=1892865 RepID=A0A853AA88_9ACTN|nr:phospholipase D-like domain-containing protein [Allostreptomyces psammosilenae]NYI07292.1 phosphatidylserine/phosphatidylglycerophosphate/cardiolipin synthase-like enzyme [Allostreptomyces psammosilenae]